MPIEMRPRGSRPFRSRGTTLVEHMIALVITAVTVTIGYPGYTDFVRRGWMQDAMTTLAAFAQRMESAYDGNGNYGVSACSVAAPSATERWTYACTLSSGGQGYTVTATGALATAGFAYSLDNTGAQRTTSWSGSAVARSCWLVRGTEC